MQDSSAAPSTYGGRRVAVIGSGYVGLTVGACLARLGHTVTCTDVCAERIFQLRRGRVPIVEPGLPDLVREGMDSGLLTFTTDSARVAKDADVVFLCLPTPEGGDGRADLRFVREAAHDLGPHLRSGAIVVTKSTVPVGTALLVREALGRDDVAVVSNPEFLAEGRAVADFLNPDRIVIGSSDPDAALAVALLYRDLPGERIITDAASSETIKYAANSFLALKLSYVNALAAACEALGADVREVVRGIGSDSRIGSAFLQPGPGWGGSCFPKDVEAFIRCTADVGVDFALLRAAVEANDATRERMVDKIELAAGGSLVGATVAMWGLTFKADTDDLRRSPALAIAEAVRARGASLRVYDPTVSEEFPDWLVCASPLEACEGADVLVVATEWSIFAEIDLEAVAALMARPAVVDTRQVLDPEWAAASGLFYDGCGVRAPLGYAPDSWIAESRAGAA